MSGRGPTLQLGGTSTLVSSAASPNWELKGFEFCSAVKLAQDKAIKPGQHVVADTFAHCVIPMPGLHLHPVGPQEVC